MRWLRKGGLKRKRDRWSSPRNAAKGHITRKAATETADGFTRQLALKLYLLYQLGSLTQRGLQKNCLHTDNITL